MTKRSGVIRTFSMEVKIMRKVAFEMCIYILRWVVPRMGIFGLEALLSS